MVYENRNAAYDLNLFKDNTAKKLPARERQEERKRKEKNKVVTISQEQLLQNRRRKHNPLKLLLGGLSGAVVTIVVATIIIAQVQLTELTHQISAAKSQLAISQSTSTQLQMGLQSKLSTSEIEAYAENTLGMAKAENSQKEFVSLSQGDKAEVSREADKNFFQKTYEAITGLWS